MLLGTEPERFALEAIADEVGAVFAERPRDQLRPPAGKWIGKVGHGDPSERLSGDDRPGRDMFPVPGRSSARR
jgi:hypothetical protein